MVAAHVPETLPKGEMIVSGKLAKALVWRLRFTTSDFERQVRFGG